jgi:hypothetical protein
MGKIQEGLIAGVWCASAVGVAGYTWQSYSVAGGWGIFPGFGGNSGGSSSPGASVANAANTVVTGGIPGVSQLTRIVQSILGVKTPVTDKANALPGQPGSAIQGIKAPPDRLLHAVKVSVNSRNRPGFEQAINALKSWGVTHGGWPNLPGFGRQYAEANGITIPKGW